MQSKYWSGGTVDFDELAQRASALFHHAVAQPLLHFFLALKRDDRLVLYILIAMAIAFGIVIGRYSGSRASRAFLFQNSSEALVSRVARWPIPSHCGVIQPGHPMGNRSWSRLSAKVSRV